MARIFISAFFICFAFISNAQDNISLNTNATVVNGGISLIWKKAETELIRYYELEKLGDDDSWVGIKLVRPMVDDVSFEVYDQSPYEGLNLYRIKAKNREGKYLYTESIEVNFQPLEFDIMMYPNPANAWLVINSDKPDANFSVNLIDQFGNVLLTERTEKGSCVLNTAEILEGMYFVKVNGPGATFKRAIVVNHR